VLQSTSLRARACPHLQLLQARARGLQRPGAQQRLRLRLRLRLLLLLAADGGRLWLLLCLRLLPLLLLLLLRLRLLLQCVIRRRWCGLWRGPVIELLWLLRCWVAQVQHVPAVAGDAC
jgi:hypothetical protein